MTQNKLPDVLIDIIRDYIGVVEQERSYRLEQARIEMIAYERENSIDIRNRNIRHIAHWLCLISFSVIFSLGAELVRTRDLTLAYIMIGLGVPIVTMIIIVYRKFPILDKSRNDEIR